MPASPQVLSQVLPKIDQLQRAADRIALHQRGGVPNPIEVQQQAANGVGRAAAVVQQGRHVGRVHPLCGVPHVLFKRVQQRVQGGGRQLVLLDLCLQGAKHLGPGPTLRGLVGQSTRQG